MFTLLTGICGAGGAFARAKEAKKMRFMRLEGLSIIRVAAGREHRSARECPRQAGQSRLAGIDNLCANRRHACDWTE